MPLAQLVILARDTDPPKANGALTPIARRKEVVRELAAWNTAPEVDDGEILYGPGLEIELPPDDPVTQMLMTVTDEDIAWVVILKMAKELKWRLLDPMSGRELKP